MHRPRILSSKSGVHGYTVRLMFLLTFLLFITLADAVVSFWVPGYIESRVNSPLLMGMIMSLSSLIGLFSDVWFPQVLKAKPVSKLMMYAAVLSMSMVMFLLASEVFAFLVMILLAVCLWGVYYEVILFLNNLFVARSVGKANRSSVWGMISFTRNTAYFIGPLLASYIVTTGGAVLLTAVVFGVIALGVAIITPHGSNHMVLKNTDQEHQHINFFRELSYWRTLSHRIWPVVGMSTLGGVIDSMFWTVGAAWSVRLAQQDPLGVFVLSAYVFPALIGGLIMMRLAIKEHKKRWAETLFILCGIFLVAIGTVSRVDMMLLAIIGVGFVLSLTYPLIDATYSDYASRMGGYKGHLIGLSASTTSLAYIIGPIAGGLIATLVGDQMTFGVMGIITLVTGIVLLFVTPRKIHLPQKEMGKWN